MKNRFFISFIIRWVVITIILFAANYGLYDLHKALWETAILSGIVLVFGIFRSLRIQKKMTQNANEQSGYDDEPVY